MKIQTHCTLLKNIGILQIENDQLEIIYVKLKTIINQGASLTVFF